MEEQNPPNKVSDYIIHREDMTCYPLFSDWSHSSLSIFDFPRDYKPENVIFDTFTSTTHHLILLYLPPQPLQLKAPHLDDPTYFWTKITPGTEEDTKTLESNIELAYGKEAYRHTSLSINCDFDQIKNLLTFYNKKIGNSYLQVHEQRQCFQFVADNSHDTIPEQGTPSELLSEIPFDDIIDKTAAFGIHIIDCDFAGSIYQKYIHNLTNQTVKTNFYAFFSSSPTERNPRSPGLPADLFSSCLNSPGKMALLWHSSHYFCFKSGPLQPIHIDDLSQASPELIQTIDQILRGYIESMACKVLKRSQFIKYFMTDAFVSRCICGFIMAQKILDFFNIHPMSYPPLPDLRDNPQWQSFSLQLDEALYRFRQQNQNFKLNNFLSQNMQTLNLLLECNSSIVDFYPYLSVMNHVLLSQDHWKDGCKFLANFMDGSQEALDAAWLFPLIEPMRKLLSERKNDPYLLFIIAKSLCYAPQCRKNFSTTLDTVFMKSNLLDFTLEPLTSLSAIIIIAINFRFFKQLDNHEEWKRRIINIIRFPWREYIDRMIKMGEDQAVWTLLFISSIGPFILDHISSTIFNFVDECTKNDSPNVRSAALLCLPSFLKWRFEHKIYNICHSMINDISIIVRSQLICTFVPLYELSVKQNRTDLIKGIQSDIKYLMNDPFCLVSNMAQKFMENVNQVPESSMYDHYITKFLGKSIDTLNPNKKLFECSPKMNLEKNIKFNQNIRKTNSTLDPIQNVSSNIFVSESYLFMGMKSGSFTSVHLTTTQKPQNARFTQNAITAIDCPLSDIVLAGDSKGKVYGLRIPNGGGQFKIATAFDTEISTTISMMKCSSVSSLLGVLGEKMNQIKLFDLITEKYYNTVIPRNNQTILNFSVCDDLRDSVLVSGEETIELYDRRSSLCDSYFSLQVQNTFGSDLCGCNLDLVVVGKSGSINVVDIRKPETFKSMILNNSDFPLITTSYACHPSARVCAVGTNRGVTFFDLEDENHVFLSTSTSVLFGSAKLHPVTDIAFHPKRLFAAALLDNTDIVTFN
ncbi:hypothetical protein TVAG_282820 [Trichomonas vaginalis G3]|uniref:Raptor N-terminal CASPase-like domain-containing protein n=1 Tax=Trichomonas vaginalis (strain ATCC PRA-98 / G3) TaxID=412133 RepID=A2DEI5_TRIV3|nr:TOR signaling [Trichomonas vaginalis G3]EAY21112.1 hypothetical protein TVAG_282820 [Trichomonas vaginalis G3]KAI5539959.1 TOR signaling [Trichomonas vaginalis G3]|eukprot:XP_001582098.1 hypothetical protein [Trichomonas vaginalis G3]